MGEPDVRTKREALREPGPQRGQDETMLFVAAVAAALVEHRHLSGKANASAETEGSRATWRMVGRLEQLRGRA